MKIYKITEVREVAERRKLRLKMSLPNLMEFEKEDFDAPDDESAREDEDRRATVSAMRTS
jgi:hypothetical protein